MKRFAGVVLILMALLFFACFLATIVAMLYSFTVESTLSAVESVFGSLVLALCFFVLGLLCFKAGRKKLAAQ